MLARPSTLWSASSAMAEPVEVLRASSEEWAWAWALSSSCWCSARSSFSAATVGTVCVRGTLEEGFIGMCST